MDGSQNQTLYLSPVMLREEIKSQEADNTLEKYLTQNNQHRQKHSVCQEWEEPVLGGRMIVNG